MSNEISLLTGRELTPWSMRDERSDRRLKKCGVTRQQYLGLFEKQQGKCAVCGKPRLSIYARDSGARPKDRGTSNKYLRIDSCGEGLRGLVCSGCLVLLHRHKARKVKWGRNRIQQYLGDQG